jgi:hypothetical protein
MKKVIHFAVRLYPPQWRERYGPEFDALLDDMNPGFGDILDIVKGALLMQVSLSNLPLMAAAFALLGIIVAGWVSIQNPRRYASTGVIAIGNAYLPDEFRQPSLLEVAPHVFGDESLTRLIDQNGLYPDELGRRPMTDRLQQFKENLIVASISPRAWEVSFTYPDCVKAQKVTSDLLRCLCQGGIHVTEQMAPNEEIRAHIQMLLIDPPQAAAVGPSLSERISLGLGGGALVGVAIAILRRRIQRPA